MASSHKQIFYFQFFLNIKISNQTNIVAVALVALFKQNNWFFISFYFIWILFSWVSGVQFIWWNLGVGIHIISITLRSAIIHHRWMNESVREIETDCGPQCGGNNQKMFLVPDEWKLNSSKENSLRTSDRYTFNKCWIDTQPWERGIKINFILLKQREFTHWFEHSSTRTSHRTIRKWLNCERQR